MPQQIARMCLTETAGSAGDLILYLFLDASPGDKRDRETVYRRVISHAPVDVSLLYQYLIDWRFARERLQRLDFQWPDPSIQCGALVGSAQKLREKDSQFDFELKAFFATHDGGGTRENHPEISG